MSDRTLIAKESERRQVTVMFADISGFTAMSEQMDPEEVTTIMNACFEMMGAIITAHDGHIDKFIGDCVMAVFGVPVAVEHAPRKAIRTAIELRDHLSQFNHDHHLAIPLDVHIGINTGTVIAGRVGSADKKAYTVMGDTVNIASRLEDASGNGHIYVGETTYKLTKDDFDYHTLPPMTLKGKAQPVPVYEVLALKEHIRRPQFGSARMISSEMVGREQELDLLHAFLMKVMSGEGAIVNIIGEAGIGKSRLLAEEDIRCFTGLGRMA